MPGEASHFRTSAPQPGPVLWFDVLRASFELALSNRRLRTEAARDLLRESSSLGEPSAAPQLSARQLRLVTRIGYTVPRVGRRLPWRADCLIQALAARRWLARHGVATRLHIGTRKQSDGAFEAHAWLTVGSTVVTGWDIDGLERFAEFPSGN